MTTMRTVVCEKEAQQDIDSNSSSFARLEDSVRALEWRLCRKPNDRKGKFWLYRQKGSETLNIPEISVLYSFTDDQVTFHAIYIRRAD
jgi:hypothetical protein